ncbi:MAG: outer membrane beta-barrel protein [Bacteroidales bacterium]|nr:outer membrane beta-barrel protein [Bacteroidales bacterium]
MKNLLKSLLAIALFFIISEAGAQISVGPGVVFGTDINNVGFSANGKYEFNEKWSAAPSFTYFLKKNYTNWSALDLDANYQITELENIGSLYAIGGLNLTFWKVKYDYDFDLGEYGSYGDSGSVSGSEAGVNLGIGLNVPMGEKLALAPELRYTLGGANYLRFGVKVMFAL